MIAKKETKKPGNPLKKLSLFQKILLVLGLLVLIFTALPAVIIVLIGLLPSITVLLTDSKNATKLTVIGCFNLSGVFICLMNIFNQFDLDQAFSIVSNIFNLIIMLGAAAVGAIIYYELPNLFVMISKASSQHRLKVIDARLEKLSQDWAKNEENAENA